MSQKKKLVIVVSNGFDNERSSVAWSIANGGIASNMEVTMFLVAAGVDWARKNSTAAARPNPMDPPIRDMIQSVLDHGGKILACPPCVKVRGFEQEDLLDGVVLAGSVAMLEVASQDAITLSL